MVSDATTASTIRRTAERFMVSSWWGIVSMPSYSVLQQAGPRDRRTQRVELARVRRLRGWAHVAAGEHAREHHAGLHPRVRLAGRLATAVDRVLERRDDVLDSHRALQVACLHGLPQIGDQLWNERRKADECTV